MARCVCGMLPGNAAGSGGVGCVWVGVCDGECNQISSGAAAAGPRPTSSGWLLLERSVHAGTGS